MNPQERPNRQEQKVEEMQTGTTTLAVSVSAGVILAADKRATMGHLKASKEAQKVFQIDDNIGLTIAGSVGDAQRIVRIMRSQLKLKKLESKELSVNAAATLLSNILQGSKMMPFMNQFVIGGYDEDAGGMIFDLDPLGGLMDHENFTATGSGSPTAYGVLEDSYQADMTIDEGVELAVRAAQAAMERDVASGDGIDVAKITSAGYRRLDADEVEEYMETA
jgi:proteasome beta subunit